MKDMITHWYKFRSDAVECALIGDQTIDNVKRELFTRLADQLNALAVEVERAMTAKANSM